MRIKEEEEKVAVIDWHFLLTLQLIQDCYFFHSVAKKKKIVMFHIHICEYVMQNRFPSLLFVHICSRKNNKSRVIRMHRINLIFVCCLFMLLAEYFGNNENQQEKQSDYCAVVCAACIRHDDRCIVFVQYYSVFNMCKSNRIDLNRHRLYENEMHTKTT